MPEFTVYLSKGTEIAIRVEAEDAEDAMEKAYDADVRGICALCSGWGQTWGRDESDDMDPTAVNDADGKTVWEASSETPQTPAVPGLGDGLQARIDAALQVLNEADESYRYKGSISDLPAPGPILAAVRSALKGAPNA